MSNMVPDAATTVARPHHWLLVLPDTLALVNANDRTHWAPRGRAMKALREESCRLAGASMIPALARMRLLYVVHPGPRMRLRDPSNWAPSAKACLDGLVDAGIVPDDNCRYVIGPDPRMGERVPGTRCHLSLLVVELPDDDDPMIFPWTR